MSNLPFTIDGSPQGSQAWLQARAGYITGSRAADVLATRRDGTPAAARQDYLVQLVAERLTGQPQEAGIVTPWMTRGSELEPEARLRLEQAIDQPIYECGFLRSVLHQVGCSIDGYVGASPAQGFVELKCPKPATHLRYLRAGTVPADYLPQLLHNFLVTTAPQAWFASYCPEMPSKMQLLVCHVPRLTLNAQLREYADALQAFEAEVEREVETWRNYVAE